jgi:O-antigen ligase
MVMMRNHPLAGVGPGRFSRFSPTAQSDPDEPWAHNDFLQQGAEAGIPGLVLLTLLFAWGFVRLRARRNDATTVLAAAALAALGIHACIEYVLQRPAVPVITAALLGSALGPFGPDSDG